MSMNVQALHQTSVALTRCVPTLKDPTYVAVVEVTREMVEIVQVSKLLCIDNNFIITSRRSLSFHVSPNRFRVMSCVCTESVEAIS